MQAEHQPKLSSKYELQGLWHVVQESSLELFYTNICMLAKAPLEEAKGKFGILKWGLNKIRLVSHASTLFTNTLVIKIQP
jgi:hypothetical protein